MQGPSKVEPEQASNVNLTIEVPGGACPRPQPGELFQARVEGHGSSIEVSHCLAELLETIHFHLLLLLL